MLEEVAELLELCLLVDRARRSTAAAFRTSSATKIGAPARTASAIESRRPGVDDAGALLAAQDERRVERALLDARDLDALDVGVERLDDRPA